MGFRVQGWALLPTLLCNILKRHSTSTSASRAPRETPSQLPTTVFAVVDFMSIAVVDLISVVTVVGLMIAKRVRIVDVT